MGGFVRRHRPLRLLFSVSMASLAAAGVVGAGAFALAQISDCGSLPREDLSLREMADLRQLIDVYKSEGASLALTGRQASFLVREELEVPAWMELVGATLRFEARLPKGEPDQCWSVTYRGSLEVDEGQAYVVPELLRVGRLDLGWWLSDRRMVLPDMVVDAGGPKFTEFFSHLRSLHIADGELTVQLDDPRWMR